MWTRIILWGSIIWIVPYLTYMLSNETKWKKNIVVGVTLPFAAREDGDILARLARFKKELWIFAAGLLLLAVPGFFITEFSAMMTAFLCYVDLCIILPYIPYVRCNRDLKTIKKQKGWMPEKKETVQVDTRVMGLPRPIGDWAFLPPFLLTLLPLLWDRSLLPLYGVFAAFQVLFYLCCRFAYRNKAETVDGNVEVTLALTKVRRHNWTVMWLLVAWSFAVMSLLAWVSLDRPGLQIAAAVVLSLVIVFAVTRVELATRKAQEKLTAGSGRDWYVDEDEKWIYGLFYYNEQDQRTVVNCRVGTNSTVNVARTGGKVLMTVTLLMLILLPFTGVFLDGMERVPLVLEIQEDTLSAGRNKGQYVIPLSAIETAELLPELPKKMTRTVGTGLPNLWKGRFTQKEWGPVQVCLDPNCPPYLFLRTETGETYLFGLRDAQQMEERYLLLQGKLE